MEFDLDADLCVDFREHLPERTAELRLLRATIGRVMSTLTESEQKVLEFRYGLSNNGLYYSLEECGRILRVTRERVRAIECKAISKMRHASRRKPLESFSSALQ